MKTSASTYDPAIADEVCAQLDLGLSLRTIETLPGMPDRSTLARWMKVEPEFGRRCEERQFQVAERAREQTFAEICAHVAEGRSMAEICALPGLPTLRTITEWRQAYPVFAAGLREARLRYDARLKTAVCRHFENGGDPRSIGMLPHLPSLRLLQMWLANDPAFAERFRKVGGPGELIAPANRPVPFRQEYLDALAEEILTIADDESLDLSTRRARAGIRMGLLKFWTQERNVSQFVRDIPAERQAS